MNDLTQKNREPDLVASGPVAENVIKVIAPALTNLGFDLVRIQFGGTPATLQVMVEPSDLSELTIDTCADISRAISTLLDVANPINSKYMLEVSSPGINRPLTRLEDFSRFAGHEIEIELRQRVDGQKRFRGTLVGFEAGEVLLVVNAITIGLAWPLVVSANLVISDELLGMVTAKRAVT